MEAAAAGAADEIPAAAEDDLRAEVGGDADGELEIKVRPGLGEEDSSKGLRQDMNPEMLGMEVMEGGARGGSPAEEAREGTAAGVAGTADPALALCNAFSAS